MSNSEKKEESQATVNLDADNSSVDNVNQVDNLSLDMVTINHRYRLDRASIGQIMKRISNLGIKNPKNEYQKTLDGFFSTEVPKLVNSYNELLKCSSQEEHVVKEFNLLGELPRKMSLDTEIKKSSFLFKASMGDMFAALKQRIKFIVDREIPKFYETNEKYKEEFINMQKQISEFRSSVDEFENNFVDTIDKAMKSKNSEHKVQQEPIVSNDEPEESNIST